MEYVAYNSTHQWQAHQEYITISTSRAHHKFRYQHKIVPNLRETKVWQTLYAWTSIWHNALGIASQRKDEAREKQNMPTRIAISFAGKTRAENGQIVEYSLNVLFYPLEKTKYRALLERNEDISHGKRMCHWLSEDKNASAMPMGTLRYVLRRNNVGFFLACSRMASPKVRERRRDRDDRDCNIRHIPSPCGWKISTLKRDC